MLIVHGWARTVVFGARFLVGIKVEFRGLEHAPMNGAIIAAKHQSMLDTIAPFLIFPRRVLFSKKNSSICPLLAGMLGVPV